MFKRVIWMGIGAAAGSAGTIWAERKVKAQLERATPQRVAEVARHRIVDVRDNVVAAVSEGRSAKQSAETELRDQIDRRWGRRSDTG